MSIVSIFNLSFIFLYEYVVLFELNNKESVKLKK